MTLVSLLASVYGIYDIYNSLKNVPSRIRLGSNGSKWIVLANS